MLKDKNDSDADARELVWLLNAHKPAGQSKPDPVQHCVRSGQLGPGPHAPRP
jgi:hypothetical protein